MAEILNDLFEYLRNEHLEECETKSSTYCSVPARIKGCVLELLLFVEYQNQSGIAEPSCCNQEESRQALLVL